MNYIKLESITHEVTVSLATPTEDGATINDSSIAIVADDGNRECVILMTLDQARHLINGIYSMLGRLQ